MAKILKWILITGLGFAAACVEPYKISDVSYDKLLVVEGLLSNTIDNYTVKISNTSKVNVKEFIPEANAMVWVKSEFRDSIPFLETEPGIYKTNKIAGTINGRYVLHFVTQNGKKYGSEEVILKPVPPIDSVSAKFVSRPDVRGIQIMVTSTGGKDFSRYYRWQCFETYEVHSPRPSDYQWLGENNVVARSQRIDICWPTDTIKSVLTTTTEGLAQNSVISFPLRFVSEDSYAFQIKYSILVKQYALSQAGYEFWNFMKKVNETQGTFFDIQPGTVTGNITSVSDPNEKVLGYFDASAIDTTRAFFTAKQFAKDSFTPSEYESGCKRILPELLQLSKIGDYFQHFGYDKYEITDSFGFYPDVLVAVLPRVCCDCTYLGTNLKPPFWK